MIGILPRNDVQPHRNGEPLTHQTTVTEPATAAVTALTDWAQDLETQWDPIATVQDVAALAEIARHIADVLSSIDNSIGELGDRVESYSWGAYSAAAAAYETLMEAVAETANMMVGADLDPRHWVRTREWCREHYGEMGNDATRAVAAWARPLNDPVRACLATPDVASAVQETVPVLGALLVVISRMVYPRCPMGERGATSQQHLATALAHLTVLSSLV